MYKKEYEPNMRIHLSVGNEKIGKIANFSTLPGDQPLSNSTQGQLTNVVGTCGGCCAGCKNDCYAVHSAKRYWHSCVPAWADNTLIMRHNPTDGFRQIKEWLIKHKSTTLRYNVSGELENKEQLLGLVQLAKDLPDVTIAFYTKRFRMIQNYLSETKERFPKNLICNISEWHHNCDKYKLDGLNRFVYDDGTDEKVAKLSHCPAVNKNGTRTEVTCDKCGKCYRNTGAKTAVYAH